MSFLSSMPAQFGRWRSGDQAAGLSKEAWRKRPKASTVASAVGLAQEGQELAVQDLVAADDGFGDERIVAAVQVRQEAPGLAQEDHAGRHVPGLEAALPIGI